jgi:hypothetical protein
MLFYPPPRGRGTLYKYETFPPLAGMASHICHQSFACVGTEPCEAPHYCTACYIADFRHHLDTKCPVHKVPFGCCVHGVRKKNVTVRQPLSEAKWFTPVLRTKEGHQSLRARYEEDLQKTRHVSPEDPQQDQSKEA